MKSTFKISGMTCNGCKSTVENKLRLLNGVDEVLVDLAKGEAVIYSKNPISYSLITNSLPSKYKIISNGSNQDSEAIKVSKIVQLKPLFIVLGYILVTSILLNIKNWDSNNTMLDFMGLFFIFFSFFKILDIKGFSMSFRMYDPLARKVPLYGFVYPFLEVLLAIMFITRFEVDIALMSTIIFLGITSIGVSQALLKKAKINCACLGTTLKLPMTEATFIENALMITMAVSLIIQ